MAAILAGANNLRAIYRWGQRLRPEVLPLFDIKNGKAPRHATYHYFFQSLDADALSRVLGLQASDGAVPGQIAIDGRTLKGSRRLDDKAINVLSAPSTTRKMIVTCTSLRRRSIELPKTASQAASKKRHFKHVFKLPFLGHALPA
jgi:hypothetical protein